MTRFFCMACALIFSISSISAQDPKPVVVSRVTEAEIKSGQKVIGNVNPMKRSTIGSAVDGRLKTLNVNLGDRVKKHQVLASLRTETLNIELKAAKAELRLAEQQQAELEDQGSREKEIDEAKANLKAAKATLTNADNNLTRIQQLDKEKAISASELGDALERKEAAASAVEANQKLLERIEKGLEESLAKAKSQVELQKQKVELISDRILKCEIKAPFDGFIAAEFTEIGAWIKQGDPVVELIQLNEVEVQAPVTADIAVNLRRGTVVRVEFPQLPEELLTGTIERIVPSAANRARTFPVLIKLKNRITDDQPLLLAGMLARVDFPAGKPQNLPLVPKDALVLNGNKRSVFVIESSGESAIVREIEIELGVALNDRIQVIGNLKANQLVVVEGNERLVANSPVKVVREVSPTIAKQESDEE